MYSSNGAILSKNEIVKDERKTKDRLIFVRGGWRGGRGGFCEVELLGGGQPGGAGGGCGWGKVSLLVKKKKDSKDGLGLGMSREGGREGPPA